MKLLSVQLKNIKSYGNKAPEIELEDGINFLTGKNGSGKSTLIEAIGFALFGVKPYKTEDFLRRGSNNGVISVQIEDKGETFLVERKFGSTTSWVVYDEGGVDIARGNQDVVRFLLDRFDVDDEEQLKNLFSNIIGVPQGMFTAVFKMEPRKRKDIFDPIINVDKYTEASGRHGAVKNQFLKENLAEVVSEIRTTEEYLVEHEEDPAELEKLKAQRQSLQEQLKEAKEEKKQLSQANEEFESVRRGMETMDKSIASTTASIEGLGRSLAKAEKEAGRSREAAAACKKTKKGYEAWENATSELGRLEKERVKRDSLVQVKADLQKEKGELTSEERTLRGHQAKAGSDREKVAQELQKLNEELCEKDRLATEAEDSAEAAQSDRLKAEDDLDAVRQALDDFKSRLLVVTNASGRIRELAATAGALNGELQQYDEVKKVAASMRGDTLAANTVRDTIATLRAQVENHKTNKATLSSRICPFIEEECERVAPQVFDARIEEATTKLNSAQADLETIEQRLKQSTLAEKTLQSLDAKKEALANARAATKNEWRKARKSIVGWDDSWGKVPGLPDDDLDALDVSALSVFEEELVERLAAASATHKESLKSEKVESARATSLREKSTATKKLVERQKRELARQDETIGQTEKKLNELVRKIDSIDKKVEKNADDLGSFKKLDEQFARLAESREANGADHREYQAHLKAAEELPDRENEVTRLKTERGARQKALEKDKKSLTELAKRYDRKKAAKVLLDLEKVGGRLGALETELKLSRKREAELANVVREIGRREKKLSKLRIDRARLTRFGVILDDVWKILRAVGPRIAERLLGSISVRANRIFGTLHDDSGQLEWGQDYEVRLSYGDNWLPFKSLSGGEQMSVALAIQMAMARDFADSAICIFDEPTIHLDETRRQKLASTLQSARKEAGFNQVFVVSHDDTFSPYVDHEVRLKKHPSQGTQVV